MYKRQVFSHLSESGKLIIRDWCAPEDEALASVEVIPEKIEEVKRWIKELSEHAIFLSEVVVKGNIIQASVDDLYNILLHVTWGQQSILRESNESYLVDRASVSYTHLDVYKRQVGKEFDGYSQWYL